MGFCLIILFLLSPAAGLSATFKRPVYELIAPGVVYAKVADVEQKLIYHVVKADLLSKNDKYKFCVKAIKAEGKETLAQMISRLLSDRQPVLVAINGDYFERNTDNGLPWGAHISGGEIYFSPTGKSVFLVNSRGQPLITVPRLDLKVRFSSPSVIQKIVAVNRPRPQADHGFYIYTSHWGGAAPAVPGGYAVEIKADKPLKLGTLVQGTIVRFEMARTEIPIPENGFVLTCGKRQYALIKRLNAGSRVSFRAELTGAFRDTVEAIGGGPCIVLKGKQDFGFKRENFPASHADYVKRRHPRSGIGYNRNRTILIMVVVEGRTSASRGLYLNGIAQLMIFLGAWDAMIFDGGGSATMSVGGKLVVHEGGQNAGERRIANALGLLYERKPVK